MAMSARRTRMKYCRANVRDGAGPAPASHSSALEDQHADLSVSLPKLW